MPLQVDFLRANDPRLDNERVPEDASVTTAKIVNGAVTAEKVDADVATQAELDAEASTRAASLAAHEGTPHGGSGSGAAVLIAHEFTEDYTTTATGATAIGAYVWLEIGDRPVRIELIGGNQKTPSPNASECLLTLWLDTGPTLGAQEDVGRSRLKNVGTVAAEREAWAIGPYVTRPPGAYKLEVKMHRAGTSGNAEWLCASRSGWLVVTEL